MSLTRNMTSGLTTGLTSNIGGNAAAFAPTDLSSLIGWWDASDSDTVKQTTTSGRVKTWQDKSGNSNDMTVAGSANEPVTDATTINGLNTINFEGGVYYLDPVGDRTGSIAAIDARDISIHVVARRAVGGTQGAVICLKNTTGSDFIATSYINTGNAYFPENTGGSTSYLIDNPTTYPIASSYLLGMNADASNMKYYDAGVEIAATGSGASANHFDRLLFGYRNGSLRNWDGDIAEVIIANALSDADRFAVEGYLSAKWGV